MITTKFRSGNYMKPVELYYVGNRIIISSKYDPIFVEEFRNMKGARWDPETKTWSVDNCTRNDFVLSYLKNENPYSHYQQDLLPYESKRTLYSHQIMMVRNIITYKRVIIGGEMGTGKTLAAIEAMEYFDFPDHKNWYIGPKAGIRAVNRELRKWKSKKLPEMLTYEHLVYILTNWVDGQPAPKLIIFDESSKIKTPTAQRSQCAMALAESTRQEYFNDCVIIEMSGTPAPKNPTDWWHQCEIACPGFIKEPDIHKFKKRLCIIEDRESQSGGIYPHIVTWKDDEDKCGQCGQYPDALIHKDPFHPEYHIYYKSINEVKKLHTRMKGLVSIYLKSDCLDLPEKSYEIVPLKPTVDMLRAAALIKKTSKRAIEALTRLRELSDGFQYIDIEVGQEICKSCNGEGQAIEPVPLKPVDPMEPLKIEEFEDRLVQCSSCHGTGYTKLYERSVQEFDTPKDDFLVELLTQQDEIGRFVVWCGFTASIDKVARICKTYGWAVLRIDGRGFKGIDVNGNDIDSELLLTEMDRGTDTKTYPRVCVVAHPGSGGMALTLTSSPCCLYYSNDFNGQDRMQSEDRIHRISMDLNKNPIIYDIILLKTDELVLENLKNKKNLQSITMGEIEV